MTKARWYKTLEIAIEEWPITVVYVAVWITAMTVLAVLYGT